MFFILYKFRYLKEIPRETQDSRELTNEETEILLSSKQFKVENRRGLGSHVMATVLFIPCLQVLRKRDGR